MEPSLERLSSETPIRWEKWRNQLKLAILEPGSIAAETLFGKNTQLCNSAKRSQLQGGDKGHFGPI